MVKSETPDTVSLLDAAIPNRGGATKLVDKFPQDTRDAILRAHARGVSNREIASILTKQGMACSEGAVRSWVLANV